MIRMNLVKYFISSFMLLLIFPSCKSVSKFNYIENAEGSGSGVVFIIDSLNHNFMFITVKYCFQAYEPYENIMKYKNRFTDSTNEKSVYEVINLGILVNTQRILKIREISLDRNYNKWLYYEDGYYFNNDFLINMNQSKEYILFYSGIIDDVFIPNAFLELTNDRREKLKETYWLSMPFY
jgi:hypothetical protein